MKKLEVIIRGEHEEEMGREILSGICEVIMNYEYTNVSVRSDSIADSGRSGIQIPDFLTAYTERRV